MAIFLRQSTASQEVPLGYFVDSTDGDTEETGLTIANTDIKLWKTGATTLANKNSGGGTHISNGVYYAVLDATDTNTLGPLVIFCHVSGALAVRVECCVLASNVYDSLIAGSDTLNAAVTEWNGVALATTNPLPNAAPDAAGGLPVSDAGGLDLDGMNTNVSAILTDTADMQPKLGTLTDFGSGATVGGMLADMSGATFATGTDSLEAIRNRGDAAWTTGAGGTPPDLLASTTIATLASQTSFTLTAGSADDDAYNGALVVVTDASTSTQKAVGQVSDYTGSTRTVTLSADPGIFTMAAGDSIAIVAVGQATASVDTAAIADAVWDEALSGHTTAGSAGKAVADIETDATAILADTAEIGAAGAGLTAVPWNASWDSEVQSEVNDALVANGLDHLVGASVADTDVADNSIIARLVDANATADFTNYNQTTSSLTALRFENGANKTAIPWNSAWDAEVQSEVNDALVAVGLDHLVSASVAGADVADNSIVAKLVSSSATADWDSYVNTTDALQAIRDNQVVATDIVSGGAITTSGGTANANMVAVSGSTTAADNLEASALGIVPGAVNDASATTTSFVSNLTEATDDHYNGRIIVFTSGAVAGQATDITDYNGTTKAITMTALTEAPANSVTFVIV